MAREWSPPPIVFFFLLYYYCLLATTSIICCDGAGVLKVRNNNNNNNGLPPPGLGLGLSRSSFPDGFVFGAGTSAYQSEGGLSTYGRGQNIWDTFVRKYPGKIMDGSTGDVGDDFYHRYKEDIQLMKNIGLDSFRFSISWTRLFPTGKLSGGVNQLGVNFYNDLIDELLSNGIKPFVSLLHFDPPQALEDEYGGLLSPNFVDDFLVYVDFCFETFGDRVKKWVTINEPNSYTMNAYDFGKFAPGRCSEWSAGNCTGGDSSTEPYVVGHHLLLSHGAAVKLYREKYQKGQKGEIGITIATHWFEPKYGALPSSQVAASRALDFLFGWLTHPITYGDYPMSMRPLVGDRLPRFTKEQSEILKGSIDFLGLNYYTTNYAENTPLQLFATKNPSYSTDSRAILSTEKDGVPIGTPTALDWLFICPKGFQKLLLHIKNKYNNPPVYITENGIADQGSLPLEMALRDTLRIKYHSTHLQSLLNAIKGGANVKGYYVWCFFDDFEWDAGYTVRFGMMYVDYNDSLKRYLKASAYWFKTFLASPPALQSAM